MNNHLSLMNILINKKILIIIKYKLQKYYLVFVSNIKRLLIQNNINLINCLSLKMIRLFNGIKYPRNINLKMNFILLLMKFQTKLAWIKLNNKLIKNL